MLSSLYRKLDVVNLFKSTRPYLTITFKYIFDFSILIIMCSFWTRFEFSYINLQFLEYLGPHLSMGFETKMNSTVVLRRKILKRCSTTEVYPFLVSKLIISFLMYNATPFGRSNISHRHWLIIWLFVMLLHLYLLYASH